MPATNTPTPTAIPELIQLGDLHDMLRAPGPCITILLPPFHPGEPAASPAALLKSNLQEATRQLVERGCPKSANSSLFEPLEELAQDTGFAAGSQWSQVIFRSPSVFEQFHLVQPVAASLTVAGSFAIRSLAPEFARPRLFYILALAKTRVALLRCTGLQAEAAKLPHGVPATLAEALELEPPDHDLENRSSIGVSTGTMHGVRFGTGSGRETQHAHLADYYRLVDRGLQDLLREPEIPLILAGVEEDAAIYRAVSGYRNLVKKGVSGSLDVSRELTGALQQAYAILHTDSMERQAAVLAEARERTSPVRFSTDPDHILHAAFAGRVGHLFVNQSGNRIDVFERGNYQSWGKEELLNLAAVQTTIHNGKYCEVPAATMPDGVLAAALMRY